MSVIMIILTIIDITIQLSKGRITTIRIRQ